MSENTEYPNLTGCTCEEPDSLNFTCNKHDCTKSKRMWQLCRTRDDYFIAWEEGRGPRQTPDQKLLSQSFLSKAQRYLNEREIWIQAGKPTRSAEEIARIYNDICLQCTYVIKKTKNISQCGVCKCFLRSKGLSFNKLAYATTSCPHDPPKWEAEIKIQEPQQEQEMFQNQEEKQNNGLKMKEVSASVTPPPKKRGGCGGCGRR